MENQKEKKWKSNEVIMVKDNFDFISEDFFFLSFFCLSKLCQHYLVSRKKILICRVDTTYKGWSGRGMVSVGLKKILPL